ncbi:hypothetical protein M0R45_015500 [Rubus argutus]|uniref:NADH dehydrogenase subunit 6 n=1 Tax=Rubus argutus TaxID=59490 RepID=A0AAW1XQX0_RUBAR
MVESRGTRSGVVGCLIWLPWIEKLMVVVSVMSMIAGLAGLWVHGLGVERRGTTATIRIAEDEMVARS